MNTPETFYGGAVDFGQITGDVQIKAFTGHRVVRVAPTLAEPGHTVHLPSGTSTHEFPPQGGPVLYLINQGAVDVEIGGAITLLAGKCAIVLRVGTTYRVKIKSII